jgi:hypothetical protein
VALPPTIAWWRDLAARFVTALCTLPEVEDTLPDAVPVPPDAALQAEIDRAPPMDGAEYLRVEVLQARWRDLDAALRAELAGAAAVRVAQRAPPGVEPRRSRPLQPRREPQGRAGALRLPRHLHHRLSGAGQGAAPPLGQALREYAGAAGQGQTPARFFAAAARAESCTWLKQMIDAGEIFQPLRWSSQEAFRLLGNVAELERAGVVVRMPANWRTGRPARPRVTATVGARAPSALGAHALLDFRMEVTLDGQPLTRAEVKEILAGANGLALIRGQWVEVDRERLKRMVDRFQEAERLAVESGLSFAEAMRMLAGADIAGNGTTVGSDLDWSRVVAGPWLAEALQGLRSPDELANVNPGRELKGALRPYQEVGVRWLHLLTRLCAWEPASPTTWASARRCRRLTLLLVRQAAAGRTGGLDAEPAGGAGVAAGQLGGRGGALHARLRLLIAHPSAMRQDDLRALDAVRARGGRPRDHQLRPRCCGCRWLGQVHWQLAVLDEAQAIKNPGAKQTRAQEAEARARIALTGTPVENRLGDLWSLFDFINPGLLGSAEGVSPTSPSGWPRGRAATTGRCAALVQPYILRR